MADNSSPQWRMEVEALQSCNCDYGCPCNFDALPTAGNCEGFIAFRVRKGNFASTNVDTEAKQEQVKAIEEITSGKHGGAIFAILPMTLKQVFPTKITKIDFHYD